MEIESSFEDMREGIVLVATVPKNLSHGSGKQNMYPLRKIDFNAKNRAAKIAVLDKEAETMNTLPQTTINPLNTSNTTLDSKVVSFPAPTQNSFICEEDRFRTDFLDPLFPTVTVSYATFSFR